MTGFADTLIARTRGVAPAIQPHVPAAFEPTAGIGPGLGIEIQESTAAAPRMSGPQLDREPGPPAQSPRKWIDSPPRPLGNLERIQPQVRVEVHDRVVEREFHTTVVKHQATQREWRTVEPAQTPQPGSLMTIPSAVREPQPIPVETRVVIEHEREGEVQANQPRVAPATEPSPAAIRPFTAAEPPRPVSPPPSRRKAAAAESPRPADSPTAVPDIQITIGRIEIRATNPAQPARRSAPPQAMSLEEYRRRGQGESR